MNFCVDIDMSEDFLGRGVGREAEGTKHTFTNVLCHTM